MNCQRCGKAPATHEMHMSATERPPGASIEMPQTAWSLSASCCRKCAGELAVDLVAELVSVGAEGAAN